ncbi:MAG TPA: hypothetical protein VF169_09385 [Albitalea sp.]|uniref:hypothetical protein n=1 Tax=Piscinibacter sp. TaxID=1903157 RepID=UPI002ED1F2DA
MTNPSYSVPAIDGGTPSPQRLDMDNLIRRELRVGDPQDAGQIAQALLNRYGGDPRARAIGQEAQGLPFLQQAPMFVPAAAERTATHIDLEQARNDVHKDLEELTTSNLLKDVAPELDGWADAIRTAVAEGTEGARYGLDPRQRDRAFGVRRTLGDYARLARLVGALTPAMNFSYRSLAQSIDEVCSVILVLVGESMANNGFQGGRFLLQAPYSELQTRRDAAMHSLRNLLGALAFTNQANEWPRGIDAYRRLFDALEQQGQGDLRALMTEQELGRIMDGLVRRAAQGTASGLRALGSTAQIDLQRFYRLINFGFRLVDPESPPLTSFLEALRLFADGFSEAGGSRLLRVARPPIVFYGLYTQDEEEAADRRLTALTVLRGRFASQLDCLMRCDCSLDTVRQQILLDMVLGHLDRTIDLYATGRNELGLPELRASAYSFLINALTAAPDVTVLPPEPVITVPSAIGTTLAGLSRTLRPQAALEPDWGISAGDFEAFRVANAEIDATGFHFTDVLHQELCLQRDAELRFENLVRQMAPNCIPPSSIVGENGVLIQMLDKAMRAAARGATDVDVACGLNGPDIPATIETSLHALAFDRAPKGS